jgi:sodium-dependent dicarboxylate transporter 2/3/5
MFDLWRNRISLFAGPVLLLVILLLPLDIPVQQHKILAIVIFVFVWWIGEAVPLPLTALLIPVLGIILKVVSPKDAFAPFANEIIFLFIGSFILARAISLHGLDKRFANFLLSLKVLKGRPLASIFMLGLCAWLLSMWLSNTATAAMLMPLSLGILKEIGGEQNKGLISGGLLLVAFATSAGGIATPVGTPPNLVGMGMLEELVHIKINFAQWMGMAIVPSCIMFLLIFFVLYIFNLKISYNLSITYNKSSFPPLSRAEKNTLFAFSITAVLWITPGIVSPLLGHGAIKEFLSTTLNESVVALIGAGLLFILPVDFKKGKFTLSWEDAVKIDWGTILLFGGGLSLGYMLTSTGLASVMGEEILKATGGNEFLLIFLIVSLSVGITELISNTATANMLIPIVIGIAIKGGLNVVYPVFGASLGASMAFLLPVSTPPNSIVYGTGKIPLMNMVKCGFILDCLSIIIIFLWILALKIFF